MFLQTDLEDPRKKMMSCAIFCVKTVRNLHVSVFLASWDSLIEWVVSAQFWMFILPPSSTSQLVGLSIWVNIQRGVMACSMAAFNYCSPNNERQNLSGILFGEPLGLWMSSENRLRRTGISIYLTWMLRTLHATCDVEDRWQRAC